MFHMLTRCYSIDSLDCKKKVKSSLFCTMNLEKTKTKKWLYHHSLAHLINDKIIANTVCLYIYYNLTYISQLSYYYSITLLHISAQNWFICLNHSSNLFIALIEKWERKKILDKNIDCIPKKNHPQRFKGLLLGVNPFLSFFFAILATFWLFLAKKNLPTLVAYSHSNYGWVLKNYLPPSCNNN